MGVKPPRGRRNDKKRRGARLSTGSVNLRTDTVQAAFFMQSWARVFSDSADLQKGNCFQVRRGWCIHQQGGGEIWHLGPDHLYWLLLVLASCEWTSGATPCVNVNYCQTRLNELSKRRWLILQSTRGILTTLSVCATFWAFHRGKCGGFIWFCGGVPCTDVFEIPSWINLTSADKLVSQVQRW